jgi:geranylgeranyl pyrophosphate synthase
LRLARGKTGPLFAFTAAVSRWDDAALRPTLEEAGYRVGTAYQLADDLIDVRGTQGAAGKTLGTDFKRRKFTMPQMSGSDDRDTIECILALCRTSLELLDERGGLRRALAEFLTCDMQPVLRACAPELDLCEASV